MSKDTESSFFNNLSRTEKVISVLLSMFTLVGMCLGYVSNDNQNGLFALSLFILSTTIIVLIFLVVSILFHKPDKLNTDPPIIYTGSIKQNERSQKNQIPRRKLISLAVILMAMACSIVFVFYANGTFDKRYSFSISVVNQSENDIHLNTTMKAYIYENFEIIGDVLDEIFELKHDGNEDYLFIEKGDKVHISFILPESNSFTVLNDNVKRLYELEEDNPYQIKLIMSLKSGESFSTHKMLYPVDLIFAELSTIEYPSNTNVANNTTLKPIQLGIKGFTQKNLNGWGPDNAGDTTLSFTVKDGAKTIYEKSDIELGKLRLSTTGSNQISNPSFGKDPGFVNHSPPIEIDIAPYLRDHILSNQSLTIEVKVTHTTDKSLGGTYTANTKELINVSELFSKTHKMLLKFRSNPQIPGVNLDLHLHLNVDKR